MAAIEKDKIKQAYFLFVLTILGVVLAYLLSGYVSSLLGAATAYILLRRPYFYLTERRRWPGTLSSIALILLAMLVLILPIGLLSGMLSSKVQYMMQHYADFLQIVKGWNAALHDRTGIDMMSEDTLRKVTTAGAEIIPGLLSGTLSSVGQMAIMFLILYFMLASGRKMEGMVLEYSPFQKDNTAILAQALKAQTRSNAIGMPILVIAQMFFSFVGYWALGVDEPFFWSVITGFAGVLPLVGTGLVWLPLSIFVYFSGMHWQGIAVGVYGAVFLMNVVDTYVRFVVLKRLGSTHPLITFFGVMIGIGLFGILGLIFGPLLISYFLILLDIYHKEYIADV
jgi:predicted PurR-regulated permease PerM